MNAIVKLACALLGCAVAIPATAATLVSHDYTGTVVEVSGNQAAEAPVGSTVTLSYTVDAGTSDDSSLPDQGVFFGALQSLRVELPGRNLVFSVTGGTVQTFDNAVLMGDRLTDQVLMFNGQIDASSELGGLPVFDWFLVFHEVTPGDQIPAMLDGDAFPTDPIAAPQVYLELQTTVGVVTTLTLQLQPTQPTVAEVVTDARLRIYELVGQGKLGAGVAQSLAAKLDAALRASTAGRNGVCGPLAGLRNQVGNMPRRDADEVTVADELDALVVTLTEAAGGCQAPGS